VLLAIGDTEQTSREGFAKNHLGDRTSLDLVGEQNELFATLKATGKPVVVCAINGRPPSYPAVVEGANALLECWYPGQEGGTAMADVLFGAVNPGAKLPVTVARNAGQIPIFYNRKPSARRGYVFEDISPLFPSAFGLSYTSFEIGKPRLSAPRIGTQGQVTVSVDVRNTGPRAGDEVVQLYVHDQVASVTRPIKELKGFERVTLAPGETRTVSFILGPDAFSCGIWTWSSVSSPASSTSWSGPTARPCKPSPSISSEQENPMPIITGAKVIVTCPGRNFITLKIETDEGVYGLGDATLNGRELSVASYLQDHVIPCLIGRDAHRIEDIWQYLYKGAYWRRGPVTMTAIAAVDMALWDIKGKMPGSRSTSCWAGRAVRA
jgi:hypothetical protein